MQDITLKKFQIKDNQIIFFVDYNRTLVNYDRIDLQTHKGYYEGYSHSPIELGYLLKALVTLEQKTGFEPVICIITKADDEMYNLSGETMMLRDFYDVVLANKSPETSRLVFKYFKYLTLLKNDGFYEINPSAKNFQEAFIRHNFSDQIMGIRIGDGSEEYADYVKLETVERLMCVLDPEGVSRRIVFAGDNRTDYLMSLVMTTSGVKKTFIEPTNKRRSSKTDENGDKKISYDIKRRIVLEREKLIRKSRGQEEEDIFTSVNPRTLKKVVSVDRHTADRLLNEHDKDLLKSFNLDLSGNEMEIIITDPNSNGLIKGIYKLIDIMTGEEAEKGDGWQL